MEATIKEIQDTLTVMAEIERRQSKLLRDHSERLVIVEEQIAKSRLESAKYQERIDLNMAEITDKLNGLIGCVTDWKQPPQQPS
jgi:hypothetical protein